MGRDMFRFAKGLHMTGEDSDEGVHHLFGSGAPGSQTQENDAEVGSIYNDTVAPGHLHRKKAAGSGTDKWIRLADYDDIIGQKWRSEKVIAITSTAAPTEGATIDLVATPLGGDETPFLVGSDFTVGDYILFGAGGTEVLGQVSAIDGDEIDITYIGFPALSARDTFIVKYYLLDAGDAQEKQAIVFYDGSVYVKLGDVNWDFATGINLSAGYTPGSGNPTSADTVESAIQKIDGNVDAVNSLTGIAQGATNLGTFTGDIISDNTNIKTALQELETDLDAVQALSGVADAAVTLGTFTGDYVIPDSQTIKQALQALETHAERGFYEKAVTSLTAIQTVDSVKVDDVSAVEWTVMYELASDPSRRITEKVIALHDGTPGADATATDFNQYSVIRKGTAFNRTLDVDVNGTGPAQVMRLRVTATGAINVRTERRVIKAS